MSRKSSSVYRQSSFDAVESTRRLSEEIGNNDSQVSALHGSSKTLDRAGQENGIAEENQAGHNDGENASYTLKKSSNHDSNNNDNSAEVCRRLEKESLVDLLEEGEQKSRLIPDMSKQLSKSESFPLLFSDDSVNGENALMQILRASATKRKNANKNVFDQRSESDSELESVDDFNGGNVSTEGMKEGHENEVKFNRRQSEESDNSKPPNAELPAGNTAEGQTPSNGNLGNLEQPDCTTAEEGSMANSTTGPVDDTARSSGNVGTGQKDTASDTNQQIESLKLEFAQLTAEEIDNKLRDDDVIRQGEMLETVRDIGVSSLSRIQNLNWNDPALRRLFMKPKIKAMEVKAVRVDPDIKNMVNEFLKTNVTENFVISRVLRENYAVFYSWLAAYLQTERNAWTTRLAQAFDQADGERKASLQVRNLVVEAGARLRMLVKTSSNLLFGIPDKDDEMFFKMDAFRRHDNKSNGGGGGGGGARRASGKRGRNDASSMDGGYVSEGKAGLLRRGGKLRYNKATQGKKGDLAPSNFRLVNLNDSSKVNYDSDPGEIIDNRCLAEDNVTTGVSDSDYSKNTNTGMTVSNSNAGKRNTNTTNACYSGFDLEGYILDDDKTADWNQILLDNIEVLTDICDTLLVDRSACLQIVKADPTRCESLVDAVSSFVKSKRVEMNDKRDIEKRFRALETENRSLQEEMSKLQRTLADKNRDALNLQSQLDRLESMIASHSVPKLHKCVGTNEEMFPAVFKNNLTVGNSKSPRQNNHKQKATKSPRNVDKESKAKIVDLPSVSGMSNVKHLRQKRDFHSPNLSGTVKDDEQQNGLNQDAIEEPPPGTLDIPASQLPSLVREPSLIEISEEKLKTLKHRAKKLEDSLHEAISSMEKVNKSTKQCTAPLGPSNAIAPLAPLYNKGNFNGDRSGPKTFRKWQKASFEVNSSKTLNRDLNDFNSVPRVAVIKRSNSFSKVLDNKEQAAPDVRITLPSETSSLLEGRSLTSATRDMTNQTPPIGNFRAASEKRQGVTPHSSRATVDGYTSDDDKFRGENDPLLSYRRHPDHQPTIVPSQNPGGTNARRQRARHNTSRHIHGRQTVSKCLRCQKLFSPIDNHKLACCYHTKDKERLEHYDQSGMLIRVMYAWKCCHEPQDSDGCCYGQHV